MMSLTKILKDKEIQDKFKTEFQRPQFDRSAVLKAPPLTKNYMLVGTAFDYFLRFQLQYLNKNKCEDTVWVAKESFINLTTEIMSGQREAVTGYKLEDFSNMLYEKFWEAECNHKKFLKNGKLSDELIVSAIFLAKLDAYVRAKVIHEKLEIPDPKDIQDIRSLMDIVDIHLFKASEKCYLNPRFGHGSHLVGGADADLIIDATLLDIKVTKNYEVSGHLNQLLGYYLLSLIGGVNADPDIRPIENVGIYFARHGVLWTAPISAFGDSQKFNDVKDWLVSYLNDNESPELSDMYSKI